MITTELLVSVINAVSDPILLTDAQGTLILGNQRAEQLFVLRPEESDGRRRAVEINQLYFSSALAARKEAGGAESSTREVTLLDPDDGSHLLFELLTSPAVVGSDTPAMVSVLRNVTDLGRAPLEVEENYRRLMDAQLHVRSERNRLDLLVDSVGDPIIVTDPTGDILMTNAPAERFFTPHDTGARDVRRRVQGNVVRFSAFVAGLLLKSSSSGAPHRWRERLEIIDPESGRTVPMEAVAGTMTGGTNELNGVVTVLRDQTETIERERLFSELQEASAQLEMRVREATAELAHQNELLRRQALALEQSSAAKSQFLANVSHEFRTPLNAILGYSLMLLENYYGSLSEDQARTVRRIDANSKHLATLINDVLDIERIEAGRTPLQITQFPVHVVVSEVLEELAVVIAQSAATLDLDVPPELPRLRSDRQKLKQILVNLLSNALKYTPQGAVAISVTHDPVDGRLVLSVKDTGIGIAAEDHVRIFEPFQQAKRVITRPQGGTGLGLAISRRLAEMLGGKISVESALGVGSTFSLSVPLRARKNGTLPRTRQGRQASA